MGVKISLFTCKCVCHIEMAIGFKKRNPCDRGRFSLQKVLLKIIWKLNVLWQLSDQLIIGGHNF